MAKISLRAYIKEIERLIDNKRLDEALAHCHHILEAFPKHIDTYRLFGKAYLEQQRFGDAADIFQRVLSTLPDDFVSHVGMSIIREDEGNLDEALFHIQQASEIQPSNTAVQDELRRLYGRRDGLEPPKIRLTRGALARMYIKGELYQQAGVEIRAALAEDASRIDLQTLLSLVYYKTGKSSEAIELARNVLKKLPNAYQANYILAAILSKSDRSQDAAQYQQIVNQLNPYAAHIFEEYPTPDQVPDQAVTLEKLDWKAEQETSLKPGQPAWADSLGLRLDESKQQQEEDVPDWMKSAGWELSDADSEPSLEDQDQSSPATDVEEQQDSELEKAELPVWLKDLAPSEEQVAAESDDEEAEGDEDVLPWIEKIIPANKTEIAEQSDADKLESEKFLPPWLAELGEETEPEEEASEIPDWLTVPEEEVGDVEEILAEVESDVELAAEIPDWLAAPEEVIGDADDFAIEAEPDAELAAEIPDWLAASEEEVGDAEDIAA
ncbi:MAG TPA: tetratricopeptide repeat protein, partial [Anaerolineales bacterium]|nr:tetratricopeptide repeat protein [Anaerolineales bacterium]